MSLRLRLLNALLRGVVKPRLRRVTSPAQVRRDLRAATALLFRPRGTAVRRDMAWSEFAVPDATSDRAILYFHGGGYVAGSSWTHRALIGHLARYSRLPIIVPQYRLAPEHPLPAALDDAIAAWDRLLTDGRTPRDIALAGDSAGGGLALALLAALCRRGTPPGAVVAFSPWTDLTGSGASLIANAAADPVFPSERLADLAAYALGETDAADPRVSPVFADFPGAPPTLIQVGSTEILRDDSVRMADRLRAFGAEVTLETWPDAPHVWQMAGFLPEAQEALDRAARFVVAHLARA